MKDWIPAIKTDIRRTLLSNVPVQQRSDPVFERMARAVDAGVPIHVETPVNLVLVRQQRRV